MNSDEDIKLERAKIALEILRQKVERVFEIAPNLMEIDSLEKLPKEKAEIIEEQLWSIFAYGEYYVEKVMSDISKPMLSVKNKGNFNYYKKTYKPLIKKTKWLIDVSKVPSRKDVEKAIVGKVSLESMPLQTDIDWHMEDYEEFALNGLVQNYIRENRISDFDENNTLKNSFWAVWNLAGQSVEGPVTFTKINGGQSGKVESKHYKDNMDSFLADVDKIMRKSYFRPDDWENNEKDLSPIIVTEEMNRIPTHIQKRIHEIYHSFIFGNWMSVIALSRCLLEYALIDRKDSLKIEVYNNDDTKPLVELAKLASESSPTLKDSMHQIRKYGNEILHPPFDNASDKNQVSDLGKMRALIPPGKDTAKKCIKEINKIISTLYSK